MAQAGLTQDTLFLACTRPAMLMGVPMQAAIGNAGVWMVGLILIKNPLVLLGLPSMHWGLRLVVARDYNMFGVLALWFATKARAGNVERWGGSSIDPLPATRARKDSEVRCYV